MRYRMKIVRPQSWRNQHLYRFKHRRGEYKWANQSERPPVTSDKQQKKAHVSQQKLSSQSAKPAIDDRPPQRSILSQHRHPHRSSFQICKTYLAPPIHSRSTVPTINAQKYKISLGAGRGSIKQVCSPEVTVAQLVSILLLNRLLPNRMDLSGQLTSCYRVKDRGEVVSGRRTLSSLQQTQLMLTSVPTRTLLIPIEVHSPDGLIRFNTPLNWIVPMGSIIDYVVSWLRLPTRNMACVCGRYKHGCARCSF